MRLNSYNMAVKTLHARGCLADMVDRMWVYMEDGDTENADCVREKSLKLMGLIKTADRWKPSLGKDASVGTIVSEISSGNYVIPYMYKGLSVNGIAIRESRGIVFSGGNSDVNSKIRDITYAFPLNDDSIQYLGKLSGGVLTTTISYVSSIVAITALSLDETSAVSYTTTTSDPVKFDDNPICLTDKQILSVIKNIDELCDCSC